MSVALSIKFARQGDVVTITGSGFGVAQSSGTVTVGGVALDAPITWNDTTISGKIPAIPNKGAVDVVVTPALGSTQAEVKAIYIYAPASTGNTSEMRVETVQAIYLDGVHVGYTVDGYSLNDGSSVIKIKTDDSLSVKDIVRVGVENSIEVTLAQINGVNLAMVLNGVWSSSTKRVTLNANSSSIPEHSMAIVNGSGIGVVIPRIKISKPNSIQFQAGVQTRLKCTADILTLDNGDFLYFTLP